MIRNKFSIFNIFIWDIIAVVFFCIRFLPEIFDVNFKCTVIAAVISIIVYIIFVKIKGIRHFVCVGVSILWGMLIEKTVDYYFGINEPLKWTIRILVSVLFYLWHLLYMENPFNIISAVSIDAPTEFSSDTVYVPQYIPLKEADKSGSYITSYFSDRENEILIKDKIFRDKIKSLTVSNENKADINEIISEYENAMTDFYGSAKEITEAFDFGYLNRETAKKRIDETVEEIKRKTEDLMKKISDN